MKKQFKPKKYEEDKPSSIFQLNEPEAIYEATSNTHRKWAFTKEFTYHDFKKIADEAPFTLKEWSNFLHLSERTLQRYAKENSSFNGLQIERILLFKQLVQKGNDLFGKENFSTWLSHKLFAIGNLAPIEILTTHDGVQEIIDILGRIEHGIVA